MSHGSASQGHPAAPVLSSTIVAILFSVLAVGFLGPARVAQRLKFEEMAENNNQRTLPLRAPRGVVFDRNGHVLVENRHAYSISIVREHTKDLNRQSTCSPPCWASTDPRCARSSSATAARPTLQPIMIIQDATLAQVTAVTAHKLELPDVVIEQIPTRRYLDAMAAHLFGYVGEVNDAQVTVDASLKSGDIVGQQGIEKAYNALLMGQDGAKRVVVNSVGREIRTLDEDPPAEGKRLRLTIDYDIQKAIEDGFQVAQDADLAVAGAAVVLDPSTGEVLGFSSRPAYDPNAFASGIDRQTWAALNTDEQRPLQDRAIQGPLLAGFDIQDGRCARRPRGRHHHARL